MENYKLGPVDLPSKTPSLVSTLAPESFYRKWPAMKELAEICDGWTKQKEKYEVYIKTCHDMYVDLLKKMAECDITIGRPFELAPNSDLFVTSELKKKYPDFTTNSWECFERIYQQLYRRQPQSSKHDLHHLLRREHAKLNNVSLYDEEPPVETRVMASPSTMQIAEVRRIVKTTGYDFEKVANKKIVAKPSFTIAPLPSLSASRESVIESKILIDNISTAETPRSARKTVNTARTPSMHSSRINSQRKKAKPVVVKRPFK